MNTPDLVKAKRNLETAVDLAKGYARAMYQTINRESPLSYFYPNAANLKSFQKRVAACNTGDGLLVGDSKFADLVISAVTAYQTVEELAQAEKDRIAAKRAGVKAKAAQREDLNLQPGVKIEGVDVGQYKAILAGLEPVRVHVYETQKEAIFAEIQAVRNILKKTENVLGDWPAVLGEPGTAERREFRRTHDALLSRIRRWFERESTYDTKSKWVQRGDNPERVEAAAQQFALAYVQGYAVKLAGKVGEVVSNDPALAPLASVLKVVRASVASNDLWRNSTATIVLSPDVREFTLQFHTQIIWNRSCLGLQFNQWPTRRVL